MKLKVWQLLLIIVVFGAVLFSAAWAGSQWRQFQGPDMLRVSAAGELYIQARSRIFVYNADGSHRKTIDLARWGIEQSTGGFGVFSNGDLLLLEGTHQQTFLMQILTFLRMEKLMADRSEGRRLVRCSPDSGLCTHLPAFARLFTNTFRIAIDGADNIFLADTMRDTVSWLAPDGAVLDEIPSGFRFPNQLEREGDLLVVANTNYNELTLIPLLDKKFAAPDQWQHQKVDGAVPSASRHIWPLDTVRVGDQRFVLQEGEGMAHGLVVKYNLAGEYLSRFTMPVDSDAIASAWFDNSLLIADFAQLKIWRYDVDGNMNGQFISPEIEVYLQSLATQKLHFQIMENQLWLVFKLLLAIGFVVAIAGEMIVKSRGQRHAVAYAEATVEVLVQQGESEQPASDDPAIHWIEKDGRRTRTLWLLIGFFSLLFVVLNVLVIAGHYAGAASALPQGATLKLMLLQFGMLAVFLLFFWWIWRVSQKVGIGVLREWIILRDAAGRAAVGRNADVLLFPSAIVIGRVMVSIGRRKPAELPKKSLFDLVALQKYLAPRLLKAQEHTGLDVLRWYCCNRPVQSALLLIAVLLVVAFRVWRLSH